MKKNKLIVIGIIFIMIILIILSIISTNTLKNEKKKIEKEVIDYLKNKYHEDFVVKDFYSEDNSYIIDDNDEYMTIKIPSSSIYHLIISSSRLIEFEVIYVDYEDEEEFIENKKYNIRNAGIYENYIYEYKIRDIKREINKDILKRIEDSSNLKVSIDNISLTNDNILIDYSNDDQETVKLHDEYRKVDKTISNINYFNLCNKISKDNSLILEIDVDRYIDEDNVDQLKKEIKSIVNYLQDLGYMNYDININLKNYVTSRATRYLDNGHEQIYLIFDYESYSSIDPNQMLGMYIFDV